MTDDSFEDDLLNEAFQRMMDYESFTFLQIQNKLKELIKCGNSLRAMKILGRKELQEAAKKDDESGALPHDENVKLMEFQLREERDQLHKALLMHTSLSNSAQDALFQMQVQNNFYKCLEDVDFVKPKVGKTMENLTKNLEVSKDLSNTLKTTEKLENDVLVSRLKYRKLLESIEEKWKTLISLQDEGGAPVDYRSNNPEVRSLEQKVKRRGDRLHILISFLQNLIASSGEKWGSNPRIVQILLLCDNAVSLVDESEAVESGIDQLKLIRGKEKINTKEKFFSSTPRGSR